jgi:hypothetical protein
VEQCGSLQRSANINVQAVKPKSDADELLVGAQFIDAYDVTVEDPILDARRAAERTLGSSPAWIKSLLAVRNLVIAPFGLKTGDQKKTGASDVIGIFPVVTESPDRLLLGFDDKHLDFRVVVDVASAGSHCRVTVTTLVRTHNLLGRVYLAAVLPFHRIVVRSMLRQILKPQRE